MSIELVTTGYGPPAHEALARAVAQAKGGDPLAPVTVVVPSHYVGLAARRALGRRKHNGTRGIAAVAFHTAYSLAEHLGGAEMAARGRRGVTSTVIAAAVRTALRREPGHFHGVETHPATERALTRAHRELSELDDDQLEALGRQSRRAGDVVRIHRQVAAALQGGFSNEQQLARAAAAAVRARPSEVGGRLGRVVVFLPQRVPGNQARLLQAVSEVTAITVIAGLTGADDADAAVRASLRRLGTDYDADAAPRPPPQDQDPVHRRLGTDDAAAVRAFPRELGTDLDAAGVPGGSVTRHPADGVRALGGRADGRTSPAHEGEAPGSERPVSAANRSGERARAARERSEQERETPPLAAKHSQPSAPPPTAAHPTDPTPPLAAKHSRPSARLVSVSDADDEVRHAVRAVVDAARKGTPLGRCAIVYGLETPYVRLIGDALDAAGIERCGATVQTVETSRLGRSLLEMLALQDRGFSRRAVMAWLAGAPVSVRRPDHDGDSHRADPGDKGAADNDAPASRWQGAPTAAWERAAREARVDAGIDNWRDRLERYATDCQAHAHRLQADEDQLRHADRLRLKAERAIALLAFVEELHGDLNPEPSPRTWADLATWCRNLVHTHLGGRVRRSWPDEERELAERVDRAISRLGDLDGTDDHPSVAAFRRALQLELEITPHRHGRLGTGVLVGPVSLALGVELDLAVVCGMAEGTFPTRHNDDALLPDRERRVVGHDLPVRGDRSGDDHRALLAVIAAADRSLLLFPRGDLRRAADRSPSRWLTEQAGSFEVVPSFVAGLRRTGFPAHEQEYDMRCLLDWHDNRGRDHDGAPSDPTHLPSVRRRVELQRGIDLRRSRLSRQLTRFDGNLAAGDLCGATLPHPTDRGQVMSASRLEAWAGCPHAYFMRHVLRVEPIDDTDDDHRISPLERGSLVHRILERWLTEAIGDDAVPAPSKRWPRQWRDRLLAIGDDECDLLAAKGLVGRRLYWGYDRQRILADLSRFLEFDDAQRAHHGSRPAAAELGFGMPHSTTGAVTIDIGDDRSLRIRGSIDRIDVTDTGGLLVVDYKTGSTRPYDRLNLADPTLGGTRLQLVLYDLAARRLRRTPDWANGYGAYWFVSSKGRFKKIGYCTDDARKPVLDAVGSVVDGIGSGLFPLHPDEPGWKPWVSCHYCEPDGMGTKDQWRDWQRKQRDPALAPYLDLVDPDRERPQATAQPAGAGP